MMPPVTQALIIANVVVFLLEYSGSVGLAQFPLWPDARFQPWQLVTYNFLHGGLARLGRLQVVRPGQAVRDHRGL